MERLDLLRELLGPLRVTSAARCVAHNESINGEDHSAHLPDERGQCRAVDLALNGGSVGRKRFVLQANSIGFRRIGIGKGFIHVDVASDLTHPEGWWVYGDNRG